MSDISRAHVPSRGRVRSPADDTPTQIAFRCGKCSDAAYVGRALPHPIDRALGINCVCGSESKS